MSQYWQTLATMGAVGLGILKWFPVFVPKYTLLYNRKEDENFDPVPVDEATLKLLNEVRRRCLVIFMILYCVCFSLCMFISAIVCF